MNLDWQLAIAAACIATALLFLARRAIALVSRGKGRACGTGGCGSCPTAGHTANPLVSLTTGSENANRQEGGASTGAR